MWCFKPQHRGAHDADANCQMAWVASCRHVTALRIIRRRLSHVWASVLQVMQGGVLASSPALAAAAVNQQAVTCLCGHHPPGVLPSACMLHVRVM